MRPAAQRYSAEPRKRKSQYELEMGTKSLAGAFFALAVVCGLFFTFGYTIGKHAIPATFSLGGTQPLPLRLPASATPAPAAAGVQAPNPQELGAAENNQTPATLAPPPTGANPNSAASSAASTLASSTATSPGAVLPAAPPADGSGGVLFQVQVFAGSQSDAGKLADALKTRGYPAQVVAPEPGGQDAQYRVEVGPYLTHAEAEAMRARLRADGYQAAVQGGGQL
ncbi:MAG: SPOR domain-containing protein [Terriglobales bacterium]